MVTRKKKIADTANDIPVLATDAKSVMRKKSATGWPKINQGTHLTVKTFEDGSTELVWDDEQLLKEVREALASVTVTETKPKRKSKEKK